MCTELKINKKLKCFADTKFEPWHTLTSLYIQRLYKKAHMSENINSSNTLERSVSLRTAYELPLEVFLS